MRGTRRTRRKTRTQEGHKNDKNIKNIIGHQGERTVGLLDDRCDVRPRGGLEQRLPTAAGDKVGRVVEADTGEAPTAESHDRWELGGVTENDDLVDEQRAVTGLHFRPDCRQHVTMIGMATNGRGALALWCRADRVVDGRRVLYAEVVKHVRDPVHPQQLLFGRGGQRR